jgi:hypothetical protein
MRKCELDLQVTRCYQSLVLDCVWERASGFDCELLELPGELAQHLCIDKTAAAQLLYRPYRAAIDALKEVTA